MRFRELDDIYSSPQSDAVLDGDDIDDIERTAIPKLYPFSLVLGSGFRETWRGNLSDGDKEVRARLEPLLFYNTAQAVGRMANILATGQIRFKTIPGIEPHLGNGVTFTDPAELYDKWSRPEEVGDVGEGLSRNMLGLLEAASRHPSLMSRD